MTRSADAEPAAAEDDEDQDEEAETFERDENGDIIEEEDEEEDEVAYEQDSEERSASVAMTTTTTTTTESVEEVVRGEMRNRRPLAGLCCAHWLLWFCCLCCNLIFDHQNSSIAFFFSFLNFYVFVCSILLSGLPVVWLVPAVCWAPAESGPCHDMLERWYFMPEKRRCAPFLFGGCGGNRNNFESEEYCLAVCSSSCKFQESRTARPEVSGLPVRTPVCLGLLQIILVSSPLMSYLSV